MTFVFVAKRSCFSGLHWSITLDGPRCARNYAEIFSDEIGTFGFVISLLSANDNRFWICSVQYLRLSWLSSLSGLAICRFAYWMSFYLGYSDQLTGIATTDQIWTIDCSASKKQILGGFFLSFSDLLTMISDVYPCYLTAMQLCCSTFVRPFCYCFDPLFYASASTWSIVSFYQKKSSTLFFTSIFPHKCIWSLNRIKRAFLRVTCACQLISAFIFEIWIISVFGKFRDFFYEFLL